MLYFLSTKLFLTTTFITQNNRNKLKHFVEIIICSAAYILFINTYLLKVVDLDDHDYFLIYLDQE